MRPLEIVQPDAGTTDHFVNSVPASEKRGDNWPVLRWASWLRFSLRVSAFSLLVVYLGWNAWHLGHGQLAPSLLLALTNIPCPTTGGTRAVLSLWRGDWQSSLWWNPFALPMIGWFIGCIARVVTAKFRTGKFRLPIGWFTFGAVLLIVSWAYQGMRVLWIGDI